MPCRCNSASVASACETSTATSDNTNNFDRPDCGCANRRANAANNSRDHDGSGCAQNRGNANATDHCSDGAFWPGFVEQPIGCGCANGKSQARSSGRSCCHNEPWDNSRY
ncbi:MAG: hypothetical protein ACK5L0_07425 [Candidatus Fimivivens sp.]